MIIDILLLFIIAYGIYLGYTQGVLRVSILSAAIFFGLLLSMYLTSPASEFVSNFFGFHYRLLPLIIFILIVVILALIGIYTFRRAEKKLKNTKVGKSEKYIGAVLMAFFFSFLYAVILNFFVESNAITAEKKEKSFTFTALEQLSETGMGFIKKLAPFVSTFVNTISVEEIPEEQNNKKQKEKVD